MSPSRSSTRSPGDRGLYCSLTLLNPGLRHGVKDPWLMTEPLWGLLACEEGGFAEGLVEAWRSAGEDWCCS